jgi:hypothetical protein
MHFLFNLLRIKGLLRALLAHPQEAQKTTLGILHECYVSWLHQDWSGTDKTFYLVTEIAPRVSTKVTFSIYPQDVYRTRRNAGQKRRS